jgi:hypothetical protein
VGVLVFRQDGLISLRSGELFESRPWDGIPVTRRGKPIVFWFSMALGIPFVVVFFGLGVRLTADLLGLWEFDL